MVRGVSMHACQLLLTPCCQGRQPLIQQQTTVSSRPEVAKGITQQHISAHGLLPLLPR